MIIVLTFTLPDIQIRYLAIRATDAGHRFQSRGGTLGNAYADFVAATAAATNPGDNM